MYSSTLPFFAIACVTGDDRTEFLHNQLSNDINHLESHHACYATYNTPKGRVLANMLVYNAGEKILLVMAADLIESTIKRLKMFILRSKVQLDILDNYGVAAYLPINAPIVYPQTPTFSFPLKKQGIALPHGGFIQLDNCTQLPIYNHHNEQAWQCHEIACGYPWISAATSETCVAQMLNQHQIGGVHFRKGCYPGQEIIARAQYRGQVKRGLAVIHHQNQENIGSKIIDHTGSEAGLIINSSPHLSLAVIKYSVANTLIHSETNKILTIQHTFFNISE